MLLWAEGFDKYGTSPNGGRDAMMTDAWGLVDDRHSISNSQSRSGAYSLFCNGGVAHLGGSYSRFVFPTGKTSFGVGIAVAMVSLPSQSGWNGIAFVSSGNSIIIAILVNADGSLSIYNNGVSTLIGVTDPVIGTGGFYHIETKIVIDPVVGYIEIRVNGITEFILADVDLGDTPISGCRIGEKVLSSSSGSWIANSIYWDDITLWDTEGDYNNDFLGPTRVLTVFPEADTGQADWAVIGAASGVDAVNEIPPDDGDYLTTDTIGAKTEFTLPDLPTEITVIRGIYVPIRAKLDDAGIGDVQVSFISNGEVITSDPIRLTPMSTYWGAAFDYNPDGNVEWDRAAFEAALIRIEKTE